MDSTFAAYWAKHHPIIVPQYAVFFNYGQKGAGFEWRAAKLIADALEIRIVYQDVSALQSVLHGNIMSRVELQEDPHQKDEHGNAATFVPGRNLLHLSMLSSMLYATDISYVVGGWNAVDVDYPDCSRDFLDAAAAALTLALGRDTPILIESPAISILKEEEITKGNSWGIPWELTRSCYSESFQACGKCDSCLVRAKAFFANNMQDPAYKSRGAWRKVLGELVRHRYIGPDSVELAPGVELTISPDLRAAGWSIERNDE